MAANHGIKKQGQGGMAVAGHNYVGQDQIWKDHVQQENVAAKNWTENWDFLRTKYEDLVKDEFPREEREPMELPTPMRTPHYTPIEECVKVNPSPRPLPQTTNRMIGWRSGTKDCALEKYGRYAKPKGGLVKQLNWPQEGID